MILTLAQSVSQKVIELHNRSRGAAMNQSIQLTGQHLDKLKIRYKPVSDSLVLIQYRFQPGDRSAISGLLQQAKEVLTQSQASFEGEYNQIAALKEADGIIQKDLSDKAKDIWVKSITAEVQPVLETLKMTIKFLPEEDQNLILAFRAEIKRIMQLFPLRPEDVANLEVNIDRLKQYSQNAGEFRPEVVAFLKKIQTGDATLLDLNEEVLQWVRKTGNAGKFFITLTKGT